MSRFQPVAPKRFPKPQVSTAQKDGPELRFWRKFEPRHTSKKPFKVTDVQFSPLNPYDLAVCSSTRVEVYDGSSFEVKRTLSRFKDVALSAAFRHTVTAHTLTH
jgi:U3 small nucleolar RNA-associated protein 15